MRPFQRLDVWFETKQKLVDVAWVWGEPSDLVIDVAMLEARCAQHRVQLVVLDVNGSVVLKTRWWVSEKIHESAHYGGTMERMNAPQELIAHEILIDRK